MKAEMTATIIGAGIVGQATAKQLKIPFNYHDPEKGHEADYEKSDVIFICVPTNRSNSTSHKSGLDTVFLREYLEELRHHPFVVIRSTCTLEEATFGNTFYWPEFLTERSWKYDALHPTHNIVGLPNEPKFKRLWPIFSDITIHNNFQFTTKEVACLAKLGSNAFFSQKVHFANLLYKACESLGQDYTEMKRILTLDPRVGKTHLDVPGPDGKTGFGGKCLPKDSYAFGKMLRDCDVNTAMYDIIDYENRTHRNTEYKEQFVNKFDSDTIILGEITEYSTPEEQLKSTKYVLALERNLRRLGKKAAAVDAKICLQQDKPFNLCIDVVPYIKYDDDSETTIEQNPKYFARLEHTLCRELQPELAKKSNSGQCRVFFINNENPTMHFAIVDAYKNICVKAGLDMDNVFFTVKGGGWTITPWYRVKYGINLIEYNHFAEMFAGYDNTEIPEKDWDTAKRFLCLNNAFKPFRTDLIFKLHKAGMMNEVNASLLQSEFILRRSGIDPQPQDDFDANKENFEGWFFHYNDEEKKELKKFLKEETPINYDLPKGSTVFPYTDTWKKHAKKNLLYVVTESCCNTIPVTTGHPKPVESEEIGDRDRFIQDFSEKIFRPMAMMMPFVLLGDPFTLSRLRERGFKTFHEFWDEGYDTMLYSQDRSEAVFSLLKKMYRMPRKDFVDMIKATQPILEHNKKMLFGLAFNEELYKELLPQKRTKWYIENDYKRFWEVSGYKEKDRNNN